MSSIATMLILPDAEPNKFFLILSSLDSTEYWSCEWEVVDVKIKGEISIFNNCMLLPVPEGPVSKTGYVFSFSISIINEYLQVSTV